ncbi:hypothetical protein M5D96_000154 [Drosophila gunungcola]|uniref:Uncharacterized protein n=1 Tax=Drosophila gunungcola TaxID=103775 RepID=A0A9P9YVS8_9MUSC|nr:hypothetical protein M5D96_000154 [Drosophila gunungcola]
MLNGKFYTGLPPKMVERQGVNVCNRQESHFYWPDDSRAESAVENRVKRRNSQQLEKPVQRITTVQDSPTEVDTRRMFHKEFASSSIQFYDNLQSNPSKRVPLGRGLRRELTPKLTEVRAQELDNKAEDTSNRRQQAYSSKIQFYDYVNEADNATQNNVRRPQMDLNDKREVELNTKNSPKLQVKRNVRSFSVELEPKVTKKPLNDSPEWRRPRPLPQPQSQAQPKKILKQMPQDQDAFDYLENRSPATTIHMVDDNDPPAPSDPRKHLRSSLCFSGDALMVGGQPAQSTAQARRSSAGQRISVGLPD